MSKNENENKNEKVKFSILPFLDDKLIGFQITFVLMIAIPLSLFFSSRKILSIYGYTQNQQDTFAVIISAVSIWTIMISYVIYYGGQDIKTVFFKKEEDIKQKKTQ